MLMNTNRLITLAGAALLACSTITAGAQAFKTPAPSPMQTVKQAFGLGDVTIEYSRPLARGRVIFGDVVPFGKVWRTGANATTKITFSDDVMLEGRAVKAGTYGLYTIPGKTSWQIMLYKDLTLAGNVSSYTEANEVLRFAVPAMNSGMLVKSFTINMDAVGPTSSRLQLMWERTVVSIKLTTDIDTRMMKSIETALKPGDTRPFFQAASYYYDNDKDLGQALEWTDKAIEQNNAFYVVHLKAKILMKQGDYSAAIRAAKESMRLAQEAKNDDYVRMNEKLIAEARSHK